MILVGVKEKINWLTKNYIVYEEPYPCSYDSTPTSERRHGFFKDTVMGLKINISYTLSYIIKKWIIVW